MTDAERQSKPSAQINPKRPYLPTPVEQCKLQFKKLNLKFLVCIPGDTTEGINPADLECTGKVHTHEPTEFTSEITWTLKFPGGQAAPITISGKHHATFTTGKPISPADARYYSEINAVILVFPYLRQLVDDLSVKSLGRNILIAPLDVPKWAADHQFFEEVPPEQGSEGAGTDAQVAPADS